METPFSVAQSLLTPENRTLQSRIRLPAPPSLLHKLWLFLPKRNLPVSHGEFNRLCEDVEKFLLNPYLLSDNQAWTAWRAPP